MKRFTLEIEGKVTKQKEEIIVRFLNSLGELLRITRSGYGGIKIEGIKVAVKDIVELPE